MRISPYKLIFFDNDGTLTTLRNTWEYTHQHLGTWEPNGRELLEFHLRNKTPYDEFAQTSAKLWKGFPKSRFLEKLNSINIRIGVRLVYDEIRKSGLKMAVLSSGLSLWKEVWKIRVGIEWDYYLANDLVFDEDEICTGELAMNVTDNIDGMDKASWVEKIAAMEGVSREERIFVGDGWGDVPGFERCAMGVAVDPDDETRAAADVTPQPYDTSTPGRIGSFSVSR